MPLNLLFRFIIIIFLFLGITQQVQAERVFIERQNGEQGQGWLFGAKDRLGDMRCWIALPAHVAGWRNGFEGQPLKACAFRTSAGRQGITRIPVSVSQSKKAQDLFGHNLDLAFASVKSGFRNGECLSRLGLSSFVYDATSRKKMNVDAVSISKKRFDLFQMSLKRGGLGTVNHMQIFEPVFPDDKAIYLKGGLSGSIVTFDYLGHTHPFAMITSVNPANSTAGGIRFDAIAKAFVHLRAQINTEESRTENFQQGSLPYRIVQYEGKLDSSHAAQEVLSQPETCWKMVPSGGQKMVRLYIEPERYTPISSIVFLRDPSCGANAIQIGVDVSYDKGVSWVRLADCPLISGAIESRCDLYLSQATSLRITAIGRIFSLSEMRMLP